MLTSLREELLSLSKERVFTELKKALETKKPSIFFEVLRQANILDIHFKEIYDLIGALQPEKYHPEGDSYNHTLLALDNSAKLTKKVILRFCTLVHDLGKGTTPKEMYPHHYDHEIRGVEPLKKLSKRLGIPKSWERCARTAILEHMKGGRFAKMTIPKRVSFIERIDKSLLGLDGLQVVVYADKCRIMDDDIKNEEYNFAKIGKRMIAEVNGMLIQKKYNLDEGLQVGKKLHEERIKWLKQIV